PELLLDMEKPVSLHRPCQGNGQAGEKLAFGQAADGGLMPGMVLNTGFCKESISPRDICVQEHTLPRNEDVVEHRHGVRLLETRPQGVIPLGLRAGVERLPADEPKS